MWYDRVDLKTRKNIRRLIELKCAAAVKSAAKHTAHEPQRLSQSRRLPPLQVVSNSKFVSVGVGSLTDVFIIKHYITEVKKLNKFCPKSYRTFLHCTDNVFLAYNGKEK